MTRHFRAIITLTVWTVAAAAIVSCGSDRATNTTAALSATLASVTPAPPPSPNPPATKLRPLPTRPRVLVFGDSFTEGVGATPPTKGYAYLLGALLKWDVTVAGVGGSGYLRAGHDGRTFPERAQAMADGTISVGSRAQPYDLIVLQGSVNDRAYPVTELPGQVESTISVLKKTSPSAQVLIFGPIPQSFPVPPDEVTYMQTLDDYAAARGYPVIDPIAGGWITANSVGMLIDSRSSAGHPGNPGARSIAQLFAHAVATVT